MKSIKLLFLFVFLHISILLGAQLRFEIDSIHVDCASKYDEPTTFGNVVPIIFISGRVINDSEDTQFLSLNVKEKLWTVSQDYIHHFIIQVDSLETEILYDHRMEGLPLYKQTKDYFSLLKTQRQKGPVVDMYYTTLSPHRYAYFNFWGYFLWEEKYSDIVKISLARNRNRKEADKNLEILSKLANQFTKEKAVLKPVLKQMETVVLF